MTASRQWERGYKQHVNSADSSLGEDRDEVGSFSYLHLEIFINKFYPKIYEPKSCESAGA